MLRRLVLFSIFASLTSGWQISHADHKSDPQTMRALEAVFSERKPDRIEHSPIPGLYELTYGPDVVYVTKDGRYLIQGNLYDVAQRENLTEPKRQEARVAAIGSLGEASMIVFAPKKVKHTVTVFTDVTCPYCQRMHSQMSQYNDLGIRFRYLAFPRAGIGSEAYNTMVSVWCADDQQKAMTDAKAGREVTPKQCDNPVRDHYRMGRTIGVTGTPSIILENGEIVPGYVPPEQLAQMIEAKKAEVARR